MQKLIAALTAIALTIAVSAAVTYPEPVSAQVYTPTVTCEARSPYAFGVWTHTNGNYACQRALQECAARTPYGSTCYVTRWWYN